MKIYIPTRGRAQKQITYHALPAGIQKLTTLVVDYSERHMYPCYPNVLVLPPTKDTIGRVRQAICDWHDTTKYGPSLLMMDDDLSFYRRRTDQPDKFEDVEDNDVVYMVRALDHVMNKVGFKHAGIMAREGGNRMVADKQNTRLLRVLAYNVETMRKHNVRFDRLIVMEDFDVALQLLQLGYPSMALCSWVHNQVGSGAAGGCSLYRTLERQAEGARGLHKLHPRFVKVVEKTTKTAWGGATRIDVMVQWKKAFESSKQGGKHVA